MRRINRHKVEIDTYKKAYRMSLVFSRLCVYVVLTDGRHTDDESGYTHVFTYLLQPHVVYHGGSRLQVD